jgi:hypothetical protein
VTAPRSVGRPPPLKRDSRPAGTEAANLETTGNNKQINTVTSFGAQRGETTSIATPLAQVGGYVLVDWERCIPPATGRVGIATVVLPSGKPGCFAVYNLPGGQFAEWWPTTRSRRVRRNDYAELSAALPFAVALVRKHDPGVWLRRALFPVRSSAAGGSE